MPIDERWLVNLQGKRFVLFPGLLHLAHETGLRSIETELVQIPSGENGHCAIVRAIARFRAEDGDAVWSAYGDASPANTKGPITTALIRMAETRSIARTLRMACDVGETAMEELGGEDDEMAGAKHSAGAAGNSQAAPRPPQSPARPAASPAADGTVACEQPGCGALLTKAQITLSQHKCKRNFCPAHVPVPAG